MVRYNWFYDHFIDRQPATADEVAQYARGFLMYLLGTTLFANRENTMGIYLLGALVHLLRVAEYDWDGTGLATLYGYMSSMSHRKADLLGGYWRVWEVCISPFTCILNFAFCTLHFLLIFTLHFISTHMLYSCSFVYTSGPSEAD